MMFTLETTLGFWAKKKNANSTPPNLNANRVWEFGVK